MHDLVHESGLNIHRYRGDSQSYILLFSKLQPENHLGQYCSLTTDCAEAQQQAQQRGYLKRCKGTVFGSRILGLRLLNLIAKDILSLFEKTWVTSPIPKVR